MPFTKKLENVKNDILGRDYSLSVALITEKKSREINKKYRKKDKPTNVLSFPLRKNEGEILLCRSVIKREAKERKFDKSFEELMGFLVIHGMLHLKGMKHSSRMKKAEDFFCKKYGPKYFYWNRRGVHDDESRRGRISKGRKKS